MSYEVVDIFAGPGGWDEGLRQTGEPLSVIGIEYDRDACETGKANGHKRRKHDVAKLDPMEFFGAVGLITSPPCPGFSSAGLGLGRKDLNLLIAAIQKIGSGFDVDEILTTVRETAHDDRSALTLEPIRWALTLRPEWTVWEQVPAVLPIWEACANVLRSKGYFVWVGKLSSEQFGVPQTRTRAVLIASRIKKVGAPKPTHSKYYSRDRTKLDHGVYKWKSMAEALDWGMTDRPYPTITAGTAAGGQDPAMLGGSGARSTVQKEYDEGRWQFCGAGITSEGTSGQRPREIGEPAHTIAGKGTAAWKTWEKDKPQTRRVSVQESAIIQSFPADYIWTGSKTSQFQQVGNAIPPLLAQRILEVIL